MIHCIHQIVHVFSRFFVTFILAQKRQYTDSTGWFFVTFYDQKEDSKQKNDSMQIAQVGFLSPILWPKNDSMQKDSMQIAQVSFVCDFFSDQKNKPIKDGGSTAGWPPCNKPKDQQSN